jgi:hypothetical protein
MRNRSSILMATAAIAVALAAPRALAQSPRTQEMPFGGGSHFEFSIPVQAEGTVWMRITLTPGIPVEALLFSPDRRTPVATVSGMGTLTFSHKVTHWRAGDQWMLNLVVREDAPDVRGTLRISWPSGNRPGQVVAWHNAGPTDPTVQAQVAGRLRSMRNLIATATAGDAPGDVLATRLATDRRLRMDLARVVDVMATRLDILGRIPARYVRNDLATVTPVAAASLSRPLTVTIGEVRCTEDHAWHVDHEVSEPYVAAALIGSDGTVVGGQTRVFRFLHQGETATPDAADHVLFRSQAAVGGDILVAVLEREHANAEHQSADFIRAAQLWGVYSRSTGAAASRDLGWFFNVVLDAGDAVVGTPQVLTAAASGLYAGTAAPIRWTENAVTRTAQETLRFRSDGMGYDILLRVATAR